MVMQASRASLIHSKSDWEERFLALGVIGDWQRRVCGNGRLQGGPASGAANASAVRVKRVMLRDWGLNGTVVAGSENSSNGRFQMQVNGFAGVLIPQTVTVYIADNCQFRDGWSGFSGVTDGANVRVVGLLLKDPVSGNTVLVGHYIDDLD